MGETFNLDDYVIFIKDFYLCDSQIFKKGDIIRVEMWHFNLSDKDNNDFEDYVKLHKSKNKLNE